MLREILSLGETPPFGSPKIRLLRLFCRVTIIFEENGLPSPYEGYLLMPTVIREGPYRFFFVSLDREEPPHIHVRRENNVAKFWLDPIALQRTGGFSRAELTTIAQLVAEHRDLFLERWYDFFGH